MEALKKIWHWLRMEDENGKPIEEKMASSRGVSMPQAFKYSELLKPAITEDDCLFSA